MDLARLFERSRPLPAPYRTLADELDAVRTRRKGMSMFPMTRTGILRDDAFALELMRAAFDRGLAVVMHPDPRSEVRGGITAYVLHPDQAWRVPAHRALQLAPWTWSAEEQQGVLLGYTAKQRAVHLAQLRHEIAAWGSPTIYTLLARDEVAAVRELGTPAMLAGRSFFARDHTARLARDAAALVPRDRTLARAALAGPAFAAIFRARPRRGVIEVTLTAAQTRKLVAGLRSNVQLLTRRGWT